MYKALRRKGGKGKEGRKKGGGKRQTMRERGEDGSWSGVRVCHQRLSSAFVLLLIFLCSLIQTLTMHCWQTWACGWCGVCYYSPNYIMFVTIISE